VNAGTYEYAGVRRNDYRATAAHNTLRVDGQEQHEIWSTFRVARRGYPLGVDLAFGDGVGVLRAGHSGYRRLVGKPVHRREVVASQSGWKVVDRVEGAGSHRAEVFLHLHPDVVVEEATPTKVRCRVGSQQANIVAGRGTEFRHERYAYSPVFGRRDEGVMLVMSLAGRLPLTLEHRIEILVSPAD
jgi:hypothetical protein